MKHQIVAIGASAGGLEALEQFFSTVPSDTGVAFFVIQHLSPDHESLLAELLTKHCKMPVVDVEDGQQLEPNRVYLLPPGFVPLADGLCVHLRKRSPKNELIHPINSYFESLAQTLGHQAVGVILSGTGMDGTKGAQAIQSAGGRVYVQSPASCKFPGMPQSVISANVGCVVANSEALWAAIESEESREVALEPEVISLPEDAKEATAGSGLDSELYELIFERLNRLFGVDFNSYRIASIDRRLCRRIDLLALPDAEAYFDYMKSSDDEAHALYNDLLIGVTDFFRDKDSFRALAKLALAPRLKAHEKDDFRIWVAGCATGEEAYSLYMLADETARECGYAGRISVFATDIFKPSIDRAGMGSFDKSRLRLVSDERLERYFTEVSSTEYKIRPSVRERVVFAQHNFLADPPFTKMDMVSCRNVLIYLTPESQKLAFKAFCYALVDGGTLFLGASESIGEFSESFKTINAPAKIFEKQNSTLDKKRWALTAEPSLLRRNFVMAAQTGNAVTINRELLGAYDALISRFKIDGFLISRNREILHYFGEASDFCANATGRVSNDLPSQLDKELRLAVIALAQRAMSKEERVMARKVRTPKGAGHCLVDVSIEPLKDARGDAQVFLVELVESDLAAQGSSDQPGQVVLDAAAMEASGEDFEQVQILEEELRATRENLEAANEELQVSNEELQSTNEELYSMNEDLTTLNAQFERKNEKLDELNANHEKLLQSTEDGVLYLDRDLCIRRFNHAIATAFQLLPSDVGRSLTHIAYKLDNINELVDDVRSVLAGGDRVERESIELKGRHYLKRVVPVFSHGSVDSIEGALITFTDITDLSSLNQRFKFAVQAAHMSWWSWDLESGALSAHSCGDCILGDDCLLDARDREGWMSQVHPDDRDRVATSLDAHLAGESEEWICEHRFATTAGGWLWVNNRGVVTRRDTAGKALEMMGTTQDIDNYKKALIRANYQNELLEAAGEIIGLGVWEWDPATNLMQYSTRTREILAVDEDYTLTAEDGLEFFPQPDRDKLAMLFYDLVENGTPYDVEVRCINANGQHLLTRSAGRPRYDSEGKLTRVVGLFQDITEAIQTEREMHAYFSLSPDFQATLDFDGRFQNFSSSWFKLLGYRPDQLVELPLLDVVHPDDRDVFEQTFQAAIGGETISNYQCRILEQAHTTSKKAGEALWMSWSMASDASLGLVFISARCVTEERKANQRIEDARIRAEEANRAKSDFLAVMSHELRTPLNPILGFSELLLDEVDDAEHKVILKTIVDSGKHLIELINEVLDYSKLEAGKMDAVNTEFSIEEVLEEKIRLMRGQLKGKPVEMRNELDTGSFGQAGLPVFVGDESMLKHILRNLISNAIKFTEEGYVLIRVRIDSASEGQALVSFEVEDSGIGIDPSQQEKIFEAFTQADFSMTRNYGGTGLGLAICKRLVELMGGGISVNSEPGKGALFHVQVPLHYIIQKESDLSAPEEADRVVEPATPLQLPYEDGSRKILLVEDNENNQFFVQQLVTRIGFDPVAVSSGEDALEIFKRGDVQFAAILLDLYMPGIGGLSTLKAIREFEAKSGAAPTTVFILTADVQEKVRKECLACGANDFITKPVAIDMLRRVLSVLKPG